MRFGTGDSVLAIALGLGSSITWGIGDFVGGREVRRSTLLTVMVTSQVISLVVLTCLVAINHTPPADVSRLAGAVVGGVAIMAGYLLYYQALAIGTMSIIAPISATGAAVPVIYGVVTGERPAPLQFIGIAAALIGVVLASREGGAPPEHRSGGTSIVLALISAVCFGTYYVAIRDSARDGVLWTVFTARVAGVVLLAALVVWRFRGPLTAALRGRPRGRSAQQRCGLGRRFAAGSGCSR